MQYTPPFTSIRVHEGVQTANKNIYSYFMKSDASFYVNPSFRFPSYKAEEDRVYIVAITGYRTRTGDDYSFSHVGESETEMDFLLGRDGSCISERKNAKISELLEAIHGAERMLPDTLPLSKAENTFIALSYPDFLDRVSIMNMTHAILAQGRFKGILLAPISLSTSLGLSLSNALVATSLSEGITVVGIEDNCVIAEGYSDERYACRSTLYGEDPAEEFSKREEGTREVKEGDRPIELVCCLCKSGQTFELQEFSTHFLNAHDVDVYERNSMEGEELLGKCAPVIEDVQTFQGVGNNPPGDIEAILRVMGRIQPQERAKKIASSIVFVTEEKTAAEEQSVGQEAEEAREALVHSGILGSDSIFIHLSLEERNRTAWKGLFALTSLEPARDLWLTDKEWKSVGLRALKEKVLFPV